MRFYVWVFILLFGSWLGRAGPALGQPVTAEIQSALQEGVEAWNRGDLEAFMRGYVTGNELTYTAAGRVVRGYDALFQRYQGTYGNKRETMGKLRFDEVEVWPLGPDHALALGKWLVEFPSPTQPKVQGIFSLVLRRSDGRWLILHDHTSRLEEPKKN